MAAAVKPKLAVSAATITWGDGPRDMPFWLQESAPMNRVFQDWRSWMEEGILDLNCQMAYYSERSHPDWFRHWINWGKDHQYRRWDTPGMGAWLNSIPNSFKQIEAIRQPSPAGHRPHGALIYCYTGTNAGANGKEEEYNEAFYSGLSQPSAAIPDAPFRRTSRYPGLPWKEHPKFGHAQGFVLSADNLRPVDGAVVQIGRRGWTRTLTTDGTGYFAAVDLAPGEYTVQVRSAGTEASAARIRVRAGQVAGSTFIVGSYAGAVAATVKEARSGSGPVLLRHAVVALGTDTAPGRLLVFDPDDPAGSPLPVALAQAPLLPLQPGDEVALEGTLARDEDQQVLKEGVARLTGMRLIDTPGHPLAPADLGRRARTPVNGRLLVVEGPVTDAASDRVTVQDERTGRPVRVVLGEHKEPAVEAVPTQISPPPKGSRARVKGFFTHTTGDFPSIWVYPRAAADMEVLSAPASALLHEAPRWLLPFCF